jgi:uncharacterized membrane protein YczE
MIVFRKYKNTMKRNKLEIGSIIAILVIAAILTVFRPFSPDTIGYFSDVTTPMILVIGVVLILLAGKRVV